MVHVCSRCARVNPAQASYCYFDGAILGGDGASAGPVNMGAQPFPSQFVFPTGQVCRNFDQLALTCQQNWQEAKGVLRQGYLESFLGGMGRSDLAQAAREAATGEDSDRGLDRFLAKVPSEAVPPPRLAVEPLEINLGQLKIGEDRTIELHLRNQGMRLICGSVRVEEGDWLAVGEGQGTQHKLFQFGTTHAIVVRVRGQQLRASNKPLVGKLTIESNAGSFTVTVRAELPVKPYPDGPFAGARSPRQLAERAKAQPKEAAGLFEKGAVAQWYRDNGWTYPVQGEVSFGLGAVQQYFEALGLTPPPTVDIGPASVAMRGAAGGQADATLEVRAREKRPIYAHAQSDQPWLVVHKARLSGRTALIPLVVPRIPESPGQTLQARVSVRTNGNRRFVVPVTLEVAPLFGGEKEESSGPPLPLARRRKPTRANLLPAIALGLALLAVMIHDLILPLRPIEPPPPDDPSPSSVVLAVSFRTDNQRFGLTLLNQKDPHNPSERKRLTYSSSGDTNNTCIKLDGQENLYGQAPGGWALRATERVKGRRWVSSWRYAENVHVTQTVLLVAGHAGEVDTCLVHYRLENRDQAPHTVGLRMMLDTFIGANDGVPFVIPGQPGLLETKRDFGFKDIPEFIQALEKPDLLEPGTTAQMGLKLPESYRLDPDDPPLEPIARLVICRWPGNPEERWDFTPRKFLDMNQGVPKDSCVTLFWDYRTMAPGEKRALAFSYGLGQLSKGSAHLALAQGGDARPGGTFTVVAWVKAPRPGQRVVVTLPAGMDLAAGSTATQTFDKGSKGLNQVSWRIAVNSGAQVRKYPVTAVSEGAEAVLEVSVERGAGLFEK